MSSEDPKFVLPAVLHLDANYYAAGGEEAFHDELVEILKLYPYVGRTPYVAMAWTEAQRLVHRARDAHPEHNALIIVSSLGYKPGRMTTVRDAPGFRLYLLVRELLGPGVPFAIYASPEGVAAVSGYLAECGIADSRFLATASSDELQLTFLSQDGPFAYAPPAAATADGEEPGGAGEGAGAGAGAGTAVAEAAGAGGSKSGTQDVVEKGGGGEKEE